MAPIAKHTPCCGDRLKSAQYTSEQFRRLMADNGVTCSMSRSLNLWDNAAMRRFGATPWRRATE